MDDGDGAGGSSRFPTIFLEFSDKADLGLQMMPESLLHLRLSDGDQLPNILRRGIAEVHHDVRVDVGDLCISMAVTLEANLIDQPPRSDTLDFLEDGSGARVVLEPRMLPAAPAQVLLHDPMHHCLVSALELEGHGQGDVTLFMEGARIVPELHVVPVDGASFTFLGQELGRVKHLGDEHRTLSCRGRREKMKILPHGTANGARYSDIVFEPRPSTLDGLGNELCHDRSTLDPELSIVKEL